MDNIYTPNIPDRKGRKRVVIIGGGFGGMKTAKRLDSKRFQVVMVDRHNFHQFQPLFYQVATAGLEPGAISYPLRKDFRKRTNLHFRMCEAISVDPQKNILNTSIGEIDYDYLIVATGCKTNFFGNKDIERVTFGLKSTADAILMRNRLMLSFEEAITARTDKERTEAMTFVIVGGGASGVELAGALADLRRKVLRKDYPELNINTMEIHLIDGSPRLLAGMSENASEKAAETLERRGVRIKHGVTVTEYTNHTVKTSDGNSIRTRNVFWVAGVVPNSIAGLPESSYIRGRLVVDDTLKVKNTENIFAIGDTALLMDKEYPKGHPQVAQVAIQMGRTVAHNLNRITRKKEPEHFSYRDKGSLATIGKNAAVADICGMKISGIVAWWLWLFVHIMTIVGIRNRVSIFIDWLWNYINNDVSLRLFIRPNKSRIYDEYGDY